MSTSIQVVENLRLGRFVDINGQRCEIEHTSFSPALTKNLALDELVSALASELISRKIIGVTESGEYYFIESGEPLLQDTAYID